MTFISYAQNFEDVLLWRALKNVQNGFYVDVGAQDPAVDSVSLAFYERGWRGVHVEPSPQYAARLRASRSDETVVEAAIGSNAGHVTFFEVRDTGLGTADLELASQHRAAGFLVIERTVEVLTLTQLLNPYLGRPVHWMKIDVEGFERQVIEGWDSEQVRPWILLVESTRPMSEEQTHEVWEPLVLQRGYKFAFFDGLNRYYVCNQQLDLLQHFNRPANVFDDFELSGTNSFTAGINRELLDARAEVSRIESDLRSSRAASAQIESDLSRVRGELLACGERMAHQEIELTRIRDQLAEAKSKIDFLQSREFLLQSELRSNNRLLVQSVSQASKLQRQYENVISSRSWRVTRPLRAVGARLGRLFR